MTDEVPVNDTDNEATVVLSRAKRPEPLPPVRRRAGMGLSLRVKLFSAVLVLVVVIVASVLAVIRVKSETVTRQAVDRQMAKIGASFEAFLAGENNKLLGATRQLADDPNTVATIRLQDPATAFDYLQQKNADVVGGEYLMALDDEGYLLARSDDPEGYGELIGHVSPLFSQPLQGQEATGFSERDGQLYQLAAAPILEGGTTVVGVLVTAFRVGDELAVRAQEVTQADTTFVALPEEGLELASTTLGRTTVQTLMDVIGQSDLVESATESGLVGPVELDLDGDLNVVVAVPLLAASGGPRGLFVASRSLGREMAVYAEIQRTIVLLGFAALILASAFSLVLSNRITQPIRALVEVAEQVKDGNLEVEIPATGHDEIGLLAGAFERMVAELRQKEELEQYLQGLTQVIESGGGTALTMGGQGATAVSSQATTVIRPTGDGPVPGEMFADRYEIGKVLGKGGMGKVYMAKDRHLEEVVAIKTILAQAALGDETVLERFKQEIRLARRIANRHVLRTYHFGEAGGVHYLTMEYFQGVELKILVKKKGAFPVGPGLHLAKQICDGLSAAHEQGVVHRDVKSQNMMVSSRGELKLMDFGISRLVNADGLTQTGTIMGTPDYMSPEQGKGLPADHRSDLYATGVVLFELFTGRLPFAAPEPLAVVLKHVQETPPLLRELDPSIPEALEKIILKALAKEPLARQGSMAELKTELEQIVV